MHKKCIIFNSWVIFHYIHVPQLSYPAVCQWTSRLLPSPSYCKQMDSFIYIYIYICVCVCVCVCVSGIWTIVLSFPVSFFEVFCVYLWEKAMAPHSSTLAWKIPWMEEPGGLQSMGSLRVRHDWATSLSLLTFMHWRRQWQPTPVFLPGESHRGEPDGLPSMGLHRVRHGWSDLAAAVYTYKFNLWLFHYHWNLKGLRLVHERI